jgi:Cu2+-exporting ATPase
MDAADECAHCALPLGVRPVTASVAGEYRRFCCYGCVLALQVTRARGDAGAAATILVRLGLAVFFAMNVMMVSMPSYVPYVYGASAQTDGPLFQVLRVLAAALAAPVLLLLGGPIVASAWAGARRGDLSADGLIVTGTIAAYALSLANTVSGRPAVYFDTGVMLLVLVTLGRYLEATAKAEAGAAVRVRLAPAPARATRLGPDGDDAVVAPETLAVGDFVRVAPGEAFPTDGVVLEGTGGVDEATLTGESRPVPKTPGAVVAGGTCSVDGVFVVRVTAAVALSAAARIATLMARARAERAPAERLADRVTRALVPIVAVVALASGVFWTVRSGVDAGVLSALAVLVVACPCALGIATPVAVWTGLAESARRGVVVRSAAALERAAAIDQVLLDKTGTLTLRTPRIVSMEGEDAAAVETLRVAAALEAGLQHPFARAILDAWHERGGASSPALRAHDVRLMPGRGVCGIVEGREAMIGDARIVTPADASGREREEEEHEGQPGTVLYVVRDRRVLGRLQLVEAARPDAAAAVAALRRQGVRVGLVSGDRVAAAVVPEIVAAEDARLGLSPEEKLRHVRALGGDVANLAMVGDGVNDAPALAAAGLGIAVAGASDLARITADVAVLADDLRRVPWLLAYARRVRAVVRQNLVWAFGYNAVAVALAAAGALTPLVASVAMLASSLAVVANARRLRLAA